MLRMNNGVIDLQVQNYNVCYAKTSVKNNANTQWTHDRTTCKQYFGRGVQTLLGCKALANRSKLLRTKICRGWAATDQNSASQPGSWS